MTEKCAIEIERECDWTSPGIIRVLDFVEQAFRIAQNPRFRYCHVRHHRTNGRVGLSLFQPQPRRI
jgi:hypothetical protein